MNGKTEKSNGKSRVADKAILKQQKQLGKDAQPKSYTLADGSQSKTIVVKGKTHGDWHYYAPRKARVAHEVAQLEAVQPILDLINSSKFWKIRLWTTEGIHSAKTFKGKASLTVQKVVEKVKAKAVPPSTEGSKPVGKLRKAPGKLREATELANAQEKVKVAVPA